MPSDSLTTNFETENEITNNQVSEFETINLTEWLIFKLKIMYGRSIFEGDNPDEALAVRQEWQDLVRKIGKKGVLATIDFFLSGHNTVPSFPPSPIEFRKCFRMYILPLTSKAYVMTQQKKLPVQAKERNQEGYKKFKELVRKLKPMI